MKVKFILLICITFFLLSSCNSKTFNIVDDSLNETPLADDSMEKEIIDNFDSNYSTFLLSVLKDNGEYYDFESGALAFGDLGEPFALKATYYGQSEKKEVVLKIYCDFKEIEFSVNDNNNFDNKYIFNITNQTSKIMDIYINPKTDINTDKTHKILFSFNHSPNAYTKDLEESDNHYGLNLIFDCNFNKTDDDFSIFENQKKDIIKPDEITNTKNIALIINDDFSEGLEHVPFPDKEIFASPGETVYLKYNISKTQSEYTNSALMILNIDFVQTEFNDKLYETVYIEGDKTSSGKISFLAPEKPGNYEITAYVVYNPFEKIQTDTRDVRTSFRFTLTIE